MRVPQLAILQCRDGGLAHTGFCSDILLAQLKHPTPSPLASTGIGSFRLWIGRRLWHQDVACLYIF